MTREIVPSRVYLARSACCLSVAPVLEPHRTVSSTNFTTTTTESTPGAHAHSAYAMSRPTVHDTPANVTHEAAPAATAMSATACLPPGAIGGRGATAEGAPDLIDSRLAPDELALGSCLAAHHAAATTRPHAAAASSTRVAATAGDSTALGDSPAYRTLSGVSINPESHLGRSAGAPRIMPYGHPVFPGSSLNSVCHSPCSS